MRSNISKITISLLFISILLLFFLPGCPPEIPIPLIVNAILSSTESPAFNEFVVLTADLSNGETADLTFLWNCSTGTITDTSGASAVWQAPDYEVSTGIRVFISDENGETASGVLMLQVIPSQGPLLGSNVNEVIYSEDFEAGSLEETSFLWDPDELGSITQRDFLGSSPATINHDSYCLGLRNVTTVSVGLPLSGFTDISLTCSLLAEILEPDVDDRFQIQYYSGSAYTTLITITESSAEYHSSAVNEGVLKPFFIDLPATSFDNPHSRLRVRLVGNAIGNGDYGYIDNILVTGTPLLPETGMGTVYFSADSYTLQPSSTFQSLVVVNSGSQRVASYEISISYDPGLMQLDTTLGDNGVITAAFGYTAEVVLNYEGKITVRGTNSGGSDPGINMPLCQLNWTTGASGSGPLEVETLSLVDNLGLKVGKPAGFDSNIALE